MSNALQRRVRARLFAWAAVLLLPLSLAAAVQERVSDETVGALRGPLSAGARMRLNRFPIDGVSRTLELERFEVWAPDAEIIFEGDGKTTRHAIPTTRYFRGRVAGDPDSLVFLSVGDEGVSGMVMSGERRYGVKTNARRVRGSKDVISDVLVEEDFVLDQYDAQGFTCGNEGALVTPPRSKDLHETQTAAIRKLIPVSNAGVLNTGTATHTLNIAIEVDFALYINLGSSQSNVDTFLGNLVGAASTIYQRDLKTDLVLAFARTWTGADPFIYIGNSGTWNGVPTTYNASHVLAQLGDIWHNTPPTANPRSAVVRLSGSPVGQGIGWVQTMCQADFACSGGNCGDALFDGHTGGKYAYCGGLNGPSNLSTTVPDPNASPGGIQFGAPATNYWSLLEFTHELGHVVNSIHTHCVSLSAAEQAFWGVGSRPYIDTCYSGECYSGATSVPPEKGTIMSYCHLIGGGTQTRYLFGKSTEPSQKIVDSLLLNLTGPSALTPDSPVINAPASVTVAVPTGASINSPVGGQTYTWSITNGTIVGPNTGTSITFTGTADPATLRVRTTITGNGCAASDYKTITVNTACVAPSISANPSSTTIAQGASTTLSVSATGTTLTYQWYIGASGVTTNPIPGATASSVIVSPGSTTTYWVRVSNGCGTANSAAATVTVTPTATTSKFNVITPCRILDTRLPNGPGGGPAVPSSGTRNIPVVGGCGLPSGITALAANVVAINPAAQGFVTVYPGPTGSPRPLATTVFFTVGRTLANNATITVGTDGTINIFNSGSAPLNLAIDVNGYFK